MMVCNRISELLGLICHPLTDDGSVAMIESPFKYPDGDGVPIFVEKLGPQLRFFDDGGALLHLMGRGLSMDDNRKTKFVKTIAEQYQVSLSDLGELEIWSSEEAAPAAFANYISTMLALAKWEADQVGVSTDISLLLDEVAIYLQAWRPTARISAGPEYTGISGHIYRLDFSIDSDAVIAITPHHTSVGAAAKKLLDIRAVPAYRELKVIVIMDDRREPDAAHREGRVLDSVGNVMMMTSLERRAGGAHSIEN
ncbi:DUF1828 domain-containing protein [Duganella callida]|uniref:DUF1828 domain-containing protein n=1 Tax=Duganella callida TaxID=2561932 RepID=A0A4Y9S6Y7_9BURK|nr:DUF1828 domain-containing protein [Duganella callida]TFW17257.1 DUF1828 domain-containing protein [Duganella callida]